VKRPFKISSFAVSFVVLLAVLLLGKTLENRHPILPVSHLDDFPDRIGDAKKLKDVPVTADVIRILQLTNYLNRFCFLRELRASEANSLCS